MTVTLHLWVLVACMVGVALLTFMVLYACYLGATRAVRIIELEAELDEKNRQLELADKLARHCGFLPAHRSSDSFTGTPPHRQLEVSRNQALEKAGELANTYLLKRDQIKPKVVVPDSAFRELGTPFDHAPEEIKRWTP